MMIQWEKLLSSNRLGDERRGEGNHEFRSAFQRDFDRIVFSSAFRRLQDKTQVFPFPASDFVHSRLTHSIEVSSVARTLGNLAGEFVIANNPKLKEKEIYPNLFGDITAAAALAHDVGNPPFGHSGEDAISDFFKSGVKYAEKKLFTETEWNDLTRYEGNAHGFRLLTNHHPGETHGGLRLTFATLATFAKYPRESFIDGKELISNDIKRVSAKKFNFFQTEKQFFTEVADNTGLIKLSNNNSTALAWARHPLAFLVEAADNICYRLIDLEDGYKLNFISYDEVEELLLPFLKKSRNAVSSTMKFNNLNDKGEKIGYLRALAINELIFEVISVFKSNYENIMFANFDDELTNHIESFNHLEGDIKKANYFLYDRKPVVQIEITGNKIIHGLLETYLEAQNDRTKKINKKIIQLLPGQFVANQDDSPYIKAMKTVDFIARMSDSYALNLYNRITGQKLTYND